MFIEKFCIVCGECYQAKKSNSKYCSRKCSSLTYRKNKGRKLEKGRHCKQCGEFFLPPMRGGANKQHCSEKCSAKSARESRSKFWEKQGDNAKPLMKKYRKKNRDKVGPDGNLKRFYRRYPDAPKACQSCGENRVLDIAHKPGHERNGAWRTVANTTIEKVWILCPTCHMLIDRMNYSPKELGLK